MNSYALETESRLQDVYLPHGIYNDFGNTGYDFPPMEYIANVSGAMNSSYSPKRHHQQDQMAGIKLSPMIATFPPTPVVVKFERDPVGPSDHAQHVYSGPIGAHAPYMDQLDGSTLQGTQYHEELKSPIKAAPECSIEYDTETSRDTSIEPCDSDPYSGLPASSSISLHEGSYNVSEISGAENFPLYEPLPIIKLDFYNGAFSEVTYPIDNVMLGQAIGIKVPNSTRNAKQNLALIKYKARFKKLKKMMAENRKQEEVERLLRGKERHRRALRRLQLKGGKENEEPAIEEPQEEEQTIEEDAEPELPEFAETLSSELDSSVAQLKAVTGIKTLEFERIVCQETPRSQIIMIGVNDDRSVGGMVIDVPDLALPPIRELKEPENPEPPVMEVEETTIPTFTDKERGFIARMVLHPRVWKQSMQVIRGGLHCRNKQCTTTFCSVAELALHFDKNSNCYRGSELFCVHKTCPWSFVGFPTQGELNRHMRSQHSGDFFQCPSCGKEYSRSDSLKRHMARCSEEIPSDILKASDCSEINPTHYLAHVTKGTDGRERYESTISLENSLKIRKSRISKVVFSMVNISHDFLAH
ncbi:hypothetical protein B9G98_01263 [Wickerhamiella sorbophila]|uniref:C2H2-type domain-containing protein n=1 Tax=Wickerhamiella sorbophila TaxID=45607 RepID=A0A2T0FF66_9ASCO|nr:hypothetical protein B9G98_01263 [Wickerhamiella sorbophila]PRT53643.1 hypothetical protein B9G98_01263 [Wickerhamiella sorbophila]